MAGKAVVVTGAGRGIGRALALGLAERGGAVAVNDIDPTRCQDTVLAIQAAGFEASGLVADVANYRQAHGMMARAAEWGGGLDVLVNNAAIYEEASFWELTPEAWARLLTVNLTGVFNCCRAAVEVMMRRHRGSIVNFASIGAERGSVRAAHYASAKAGVLGLTRSLCRELGPYGIRVNAVSPGIIRTELNEMSVREREESYLREIPLGRLGEPQDLVGLVAYLASDESRYVSGQTFSVNGGLHRG